MTTELYKDSNNLWHFNGITGVPTNKVVMIFPTISTVIFQWIDQNFQQVFSEPLLITNVLKENGSGYTDKADLLATCSDFFVDATQLLGDLNLILDNINGEVI